MKKILFYTHFLAKGGLEKASLDYFKLLKENNIEFDIAIDYNFGKDNWFESELPQGVKYFFIKSEKISRLIYLMRNKGKKNRFYNIFLYILIIISDFIYYHLKMKKKLKENNYTTTITFFQFMPSYLTKNKDMNHIIYLHGSVEHYFIGVRKFFKKSYLNKLKKYSYIVTVCKDMKNQLLKMYPGIQKNKIIPIYNPVDIDEIKNKSIEINKLSEEDKKLVNNKYMCTVCRLDEGQKDVTTLIKGYKIAYEINKELDNLYIIGEGPDKINLIKLVDNLHLTNKIKFLGKKNNPYIWIKNSTLFLLSSKYEGFGLVLLEALILKKKIISSNCPVGPSEILEEGRLGKLYPVGEYKVLGQQILEFLEEENVNYRDETINRFSKKESLHKLLQIL